MKDVGIARKKRNGSGRATSTESSTLDSTDIPVRSVVDSDSSGESAATSVTPSSASSNEGTDITDDDEMVLRKDWSRKDSSTAVVSRRNAFSFDAINLLSDYESARSRFQVDITNLSMLTGFNMGKSIIPILSADASRFASLMSLQQW